MNAMLQLDWGSSSDFKQNKRESSHAEQIGRAWKHVIRLCFLTPSRRFANQPAVSSANEGILLQWPSIAGCLRLVRLRALRRRLNMAETLERLSCATADAKSHVVHLPFTGRMQRVFMLLFYNCLYIVGCHRRHFPELAPLLCREVTEIQEP